MKLTKKDLRLALKENDHTRVWKLIALKVKHTPEKKEVYEIIRNVAITQRDHGKAWAMAYQSLRKRSLENKMELAWYNRGAYRQYDDSHYRTVALKMLRELHDENHGSYTKVPVLGHTRLYFCSPVHGHSDYNKVRTCAIEGNEAFCNKVIDLGERIFAKKSA